eukprot:TRINITY_DN8623_c0_g1_i1.p1 TRINITY_DN8623_c0_g1~~TRINITY_DN8623_c0_g1_i1.p1  ORF type:complete len:238 (+),score=40.58 TRINITY_DN8623_c0_g1_i1:40-753(+)
MKVGELYSKFMIPFYVSTAFYWVFYIPNDQPGLVTMLLKIAPTVSLYVGLEQRFKELGDDRNGYQKNLGYGLLASVVGDAALVWDSLFLVGMVAFATGHFFYIRALQLKTRSFFGSSIFYSIGLGVVLYGLAALIWHMLLRTGLQDDVLLSYGVPVYIAWLTTTVWRAGSVGDEMIFLGAALFMISDACIGINKFAFTIPFSQVVIMSTYQVGQFLITLSGYLPQNIASVNFRRKKL